MIYTVKELSDMAGVSVRTLHYYDEIGLLEPSQVQDNGYRYYEDDAVLKLQQILFYREMDLSLKEIEKLMHMPDFDVLRALSTHRDKLQARIRRLNDLINTIDLTILHITGEQEMAKKKKLFQGFTKEEEEKYQQEATERWGADEVKASYKLWNSYGKDKQDAIKQEGNQIYSDLATLIDAGKSADSDDVQAVIARWHQHMRYFYEPSIERLRGLGELYNDSPDFLANFEQIHQQLAPFMREAINIYCDKLEA